MKNYESIKNELMDIIQLLDDYDIIQLHNEYCDENSFYADKIEFMYSFNELFYGTQIQDFLQNYDITNFNFNDKYYQIDDDGTLESFNWIDEYIFYSEIVTMILEDYNYYLNNYYPQDIKDYIEENIDYFEE